MHEVIQEFQRRFDNELKDVKNIEGLNILRDRWLDRRLGMLYLIRRQMQFVAPEHRGDFGKSYNEFHQYVEIAIARNSEVLPGATGEFPHNKLTEGDEGQLSVVMTIVEDRLVLNFGKPLSWIAMSKDEVYGFMSLLSVYYRRMGGGK